MLRISVTAMRAGRDSTGQGLFIADAEVDRLLDQPPCVPVMKERSRLAVAPGTALTLRLPRLAAAFDLNLFECDVVLLCLAPELDRKYERIYAYLQDDVHAGSPTVAFALAL